MRKKIKQWLSNRKTVNVNKLAKKEQGKHAGILIIIASISYGFYVFSSTKPQEVAQKEKPRFDGVFDKAFNKNSEEALIVKQQRELDGLKTLIARNEKKQEEKLKKQEPDKETKVLMQAMLEKLNNLEQDNKNTKEQLEVALLSSRQASLTNLRPPTREEMEAKKRQKHRTEREILSKAGLETVRFNARKHSSKNIRTAKNYVWAGTFVEGVLLTGILGDAGINGSKNMGTALIRFTSNGIMPNEQQSRLNGCFALTSTYGDLSGSSIVLHLDTVSCSGKEINFEKRAYGSVFDLDAMQDIRGTSLLKTKPLLGYSAAAGMLAGFGDGLKNIGTAQTLNPGNGSITTYGTGATLLQSAGGGVLTNPANRISDYIMRIADIYHPLVVARAGRRVSVLFTQGFWIDKDHQVYESGKSIEEAQNEPSITTTISSATSVEGQLASENTQQNSGARDASTYKSNQVDEDFLKQNNSSTTPSLFSNLQKKEPTNG